MEKFIFSNEPFITNWLNELSLTIMKIIEKNPSIFTSEIWKIIRKYKMLKNRSQLYRYFNILENYNLIIIYSWKNSWKNSQNNIGHSYRITKKGSMLLKLLSKNFEK